MVTETSSGILRRFTPQNDTGSYFTFPTNLTEGSFESKLIS